ncbi:hypothetical protein [Streptomyces sp. LN785]|uniref:hypothetical protein n=1 Tax=Streptomyces sp. LN785 TaxID=3112983 RepID=UPI003714752F
MDEDQGKDPPPASPAPAARGASALRDMVGRWTEEIAAIVGRTPARRRKPGSSTRRGIRLRRPRETASDVHARVVTAFAAACGTGDLNTLVSLLDPDATVLSDGGGRVCAAPNPIHGADRISCFVLGALSQRPGLDATPQSVNGRTGLVLRRDGIVSGVVSFDVRGEKITDVWLVLNPDKLRSWNRS